VKLKVVKLKGLSTEQYLSFFGEDWVNADVIATVSEVKGRSRLIRFDHAHLGDRTLGASLLLDISFAAAVVHAVPLAVPLAVPPVAANDDLYPMSGSESDDASFGNSDEEQEPEHNPNVPNDVALVGAGANGDEDDSLSDCDSISDNEAVMGPAAAIPLAVAAGNGKKKKKAWNDSLRKVHGLTWEDATVVHDVRGSESDYAGQFKPHVRWGDTQQPTKKTMQDYFFHFFLTPAYRRKLIMFMNQRLHKKNARPVDGPHEFFRFIGLMLVCGVYNGMSRDDLFTKRSSWVFKLPELNTFMKKYRFELLLGAMGFCPLSEDHVTVTNAGTEPADSYVDIRSWTDWAVAQPLIDAFNLSRQDGFMAGNKLCVDESVSKWMGKDHRHIGGMCHVTKIIRKPVGVGCEIKNCCCAKTGVMLTLELVPNKHGAPREFDDAGVGKNAACLLRLIKPFKGSGRTVVADSGFGCVSLASFMMSEMGLHLLAMVKTAHRLFPKDFLLLYPYQSAGECKVLKTTFNGQTLYAAGWNDKRVKTIVATCSSSTAGVPHRKKRWVNSKTTKRSVVFYKDVPRSLMFSDYFGGAQAIDVHNHRRQGSLALEAIKTHSWRARMFSTVLGMCVIDAFLAFSEFEPDNAGLNQSDFVMDLAESLIGNNFVNRGGDLGHSSDVADTAERMPHTFNKLKHLAAFDEPSMKRCAVNNCTRKSRRYCVQCSVDDGNRRNCLSYCSHHEMDHVIGSIRNNQNTDE
jgi:hypothetical protein